MAKSVLIIDDDLDVLDALRVLLEDEFDQIQTESNPNRLSTIALQNFDVILLDMNFSAGINTGNEGLFWLNKIRERQHDIIVILMTAYGNISLAVEAIKRGATDFVLKPWDNEKMVATIHAALKHRQSLLKKPEPESGGEFVPGRSITMQKLQQQIERVAATDANVLLLGENGTGKEVIARELHRLSKRSQQGFYMVDLTALPATLLESELFGHMKGAFTDAKGERRGRFEEANGGTLFLDEIGNVPFAQQSKLLTALQNRSVTRLGSNVAVPVDVRLISATNATLEQMVSAGTFRQDLFYRLNTITLKIPPLRERQEDILTLAEYFLRQYALRYQREITGLSDSAVKLIMMHSWPGNVRELQHAMEKAVILAGGSVIDVHDLDLSISSKPFSQDEVRTLDDMEKDALIRSLVAHDGNIVQAAKALGITRQTLYNKMKKYGL